MNILKKLLGWYSAIMLTIACLVMFIELFVPVMPEEAPTFAGDQTGDLIGFILYLPIVIYVWLTMFERGR
jgi:hypothetical protein